MEQKWALRDPHFGNAREVRNVFESAIAEHANRLAQSSSLTDDDLVTLQEADIVTAFDTGYAADVIVISPPQPAM